jgi:hypothetical protein
VGNKRVNGDSPRDKQKELENLEATYREQMVFYNHPVDIVLLIAFWLSKISKHSISGRWNQHCTSGAASIM